MKQNNKAQSGTLRRVLAYIRPYGSLLNTVPFTQNAITRINKTVITPNPLLILST